MFVTAKARLCPKRLETGRPGLPLISQYNSSGANVNGRMMPMAFRRWFAARTDRWSWVTVEKNCGLGRRTRSESTLLPRIFAPWADERRSVGQHRPTAFLTVDRGLPQHASNHRATTPASAWPGADPRSFADHFKGLGAGLNRFEHGASANLVAETGRLEVVENRLLFAFSFQFVDGMPLRKLFSQQV